MASGQAYTDAEEHRRWDGRRGEGLAPRAAINGSERTCAEPESSAAPPVRAFTTARQAWNPPCKRRAPGVLTRRSG